MELLPIGMRQIRQGWSISVQKDKIMSEKKLQLSQNKISVKNWIKIALCFEETCWKKKFTIIVEHPIQLGLRGDISQLMSEACGPLSLKLWLCITRIEWVLKYDRRWGEQGILFTDYCNNWLNYSKILPDSTWLARYTFFLFIYVRMRSATIGHINGPWTGIVFLLIVKFPYDSLHN